MKAVLAFVRREAVLCIALACAAASCFFVPPSAEYLSYIDARVLALLFCLIAAVAGLSKAGLMRRLSSALLSRAKDGRHLALLLSLSCFFLAMFVTNDVSLITFVPLTVMILQQAGLADLMIPVVTLETIAANLGSALTPVGNPQNLYLYTAYSLSPGVFFSITVPLCAVSLLLLLLFLLMIPRKHRRRAGIQSAPWAGARAARRAVCAVPAGRVFRAVVANTARRGAGGSAAV